MFYRSSNRMGAKDMFSRLACASLALALFTQFSVAPADAQVERRTKPQKQRTASEPAKPLSVQGPLISLVSLNQQRMFVYDANGFVVQTRVSSGRAGHETPKGIYSILEKKIDHTSNIYLDAKMPHMQRLTMTGIALHGGVIPGYPASGGCVRLPYDFARRFFTMTDINQRVVIAPDVNSPVGVEHPLLVSALPSVAATTGSVGNRANASSTAAEVAEAVIGVSSAHAATEPASRTLESAAEERRAERQALVDGIAKAGDRRTAAADGEKSALKALGDARNAAKAARNDAAKAAREAGKAKSELQSQERKIKSIVQRIPKNDSKIRADKLQDLRTQEAEARARIAPATEAAERAKAAAKTAADQAKAADAAVDKAQDALKAAKAEIKDAANAEVAAKKAVAAFERREANRALPVSVFVSSQTGTVSVRQGFELVLQEPVSIDNPEVPLDTFIFSAVDWKDGSKTGLKWTATEVNEVSNGMTAYDEDTGSRKKKKAPEQIAMPAPTDAAKAARTLDRIKLSPEVSDKLAEVVKPGSSLIVSSYDVSKSETKYAGTDFIVQMPEVVAKITKPTPRPRPVEVVQEGGGGCFFFCPSYSSAQPKKKKVGGGKSTVW